MKIGTAWRDITPSKPLPLLGQMHERLGEYTRDPLTVNVAMLSDGDLKVAVISVDVCMIPEALARRLRNKCAEKCAEKCAISADRVLISATHTHVAPCTTDRIVGKADPEFIESLEQAVVESVSSAIDDLDDVDVYAGTGHIDQMGWNRRGLREDGGCHMYYGSWFEDFVGIEGPRDGSVSVVFARRPDSDSVKLVMTSFSTHPNSVEGESFYSADIPGEVRRVLRGVLGDDVGVVYLTGAAGNTAPSIMEDNRDAQQPWRGESGLLRSGQCLGGEILRVIAQQTKPMESPKLRLEREELEIPIRPWDEASEFSHFGSGMLEFFKKSKADWDRMLKEKSPVTAPVSVVRIGDAALLLNAAELYCEFGLAMKEKSPARVNLVGQLNNGWIGYVPTPQAIKHGGYSAQSSWVTKLAPEAGWSIVKATGELLDQAFAD